MIERALAKDPEERYPSAGDLGRAALAAAAGRARRASASGSWPRAPPRRSSRRRSRRPPGRDAPCRTTTQLRPEAETRVVHGAAAPAPRARSPRLVVVALAAGRRGRARSRWRRRRPPERDAAGHADRDGHGDAAAHASVAAEVTVGRRPNVVRADGDNVFVGSFRDTACTLSRAKTGKRPLLRAEGRRRASTTARSAAARSGWPSSRAAQLVRLDARDRPADRRPDRRCRCTPSAVAVTSDAGLGRLVPGSTGRPDQLAQDRPADGRDARPVSDTRTGSRSLATEPAALWVAARRRALHPARRPRDRPGRQDDPRRHRPRRGHRLRPRLAVGRHARGRHRLQDHTATGDDDPDQRRAAARRLAVRGDTSASPTTLEQHSRDRRASRAGRSASRSGCRSTRSRSRSTATASGSGSQPRRIARRTAKALTGRGG